MNEERVMRLYDAITAVREEYIEDAARPCRRIRWAAWAAVAACLFLAIGGWSFLQPLGFAIANPFLRAGRGDSTGSGSGTSSDAYHYYAGPVLPLAAEKEGLTAERSVEFDFSLYDPGLKDDGRYTYLRSRQSCLVTDTYRLSAEEGGTYTLYYPFMASLTDVAALLPKVTVDGAAVDAELLIGPGSLSVFSWEDLKDMTGDDHLNRTLSAAATAEEKVTVYALSDLHGEQGDKAPNPTVALEYSLDMQKSAVVTFGFNGGSNNLQTGTGSRMVSVWENRRTVYLLVLGEDLKDWSLHGYADGSCETPMEGVGATVTRFESTLGEMLTLLWKDYRSPYLADKLAALPDTNTLAVLTERYLRERPSANGNLLWSVRQLPFGLEDAFDQVLSQSRVLYLRFQAEIPAGAETTIEVRLAKYPSINHSGRERERRGFDLAGKLGSNIAFTGLEASLSGTEYIVIYSQDFGFDLKNGVTKVTLDPEGEHWYMDVGMAAKPK